MHYKHPGDPAMIYTVNENVMDTLWNDFYLFLSTVSHWILLHVFPLQYYKTAVFLCENQYDCNHYWNYFKYYYLLLCSCSRLYIHQVKVLKEFILDSTTHVQPLFSCILYSVLSPLFFPPDRLCTPDAFLPYSSVMCVMFVWWTLTFYAWGPSEQFRPEEEKEGGCLKVNKCTLLFSSLTRECIKVETKAANVTTFWSKH